MDKIIKLQKEYNKAKDSAHKQFRRHLKNSGWSTNDIELFLKKGI